MRDAIEAAAFAKRGSWPTAGGTLDQPAVLLNACRYVWTEEANNRIELKIPDDDG